jgi:hypothetical protein
VVIGAGKLKNGAENFSRFYGFALPTPDVQIIAKIAAIPTFASIHLVSRRATLAGANSIRATLGIDGTVSIAEATASTVALTALIPLAVGDIVALRSVGTKHTLYVNGVLKATATTAAVPTATHAGLLRDSSAVFSLDDLKVAV